MMHAENVGSFLVGKLDDVEAVVRSMCAAEKGNLEGLNKKEHRLSNHHARMTFAEPTEQKSVRSSFCSQVGSGIQ